MNTMLDDKAGESKADPEIDGRNGKGQSNPETLRLSKDGINELMSACADKIGKRGWGKVAVEFVFEDGQIATYKVTAEATGRARNTRPKK